ncbi:MAG: bifunctional adenosylcobinamide kinase/adenosylcobinamide-phosphate guanylyltransferase [Verrucomicrobiota bacterium]|nr:bifunctional adenosylcobinamide kinase/adenosylcobinamide-phosphate guanylyltransferase [Verrucomicrobiota bacterium]
MIAQPAPQASLHLVIGGSRSGKSRHAEALASSSGLPVCYVATYATHADDAEMRKRIEQHRERRPAHWKTVENRFDLQELMREHEGELLLVDCLTLWLSFLQVQQRSEEQILAELEAALRMAGEKSGALILVSNELGMGLVPVTPAGRDFRDLCGRANQLAAAHATRVDFMVAGLPLTLKGSRE